MLLLRLVAPLILIYSAASVAQTAPDLGLNVPAGQIRIPVLVKDRKGKDISGLKLDDFKILDNGKPAQITGIREFASLPPTVAHFTVFYLDDRRLTIEQMTSARKLVDAALPAALSENGYVAIVTGTGSANSGFLRDTGQLRKALESIRPTPFAAVGTRAHNFDVIGTYASLADFASRMSSLPGRRLLVFLSPGFTAEFSEVKSAAATAIERIVQSGVVVNAIHPQELADGPLGDDHQVLEEICVATGGTLFPGNAVPSAFLQYPESIYLVDVSSANIRADGSPHQLKVIVACPGCRAHARESFVVLKTNP